MFYKKKKFVTFVNLYEVLNHYFTLTTSSETVISQMSHFQYLTLSKIIIFILQLQFVKNYKIL